MLLELFEREVLSNSALQILLHELPIQQKISPNLAVLLSLGALRCVYRLLLLLLLLLVPLTPFELLVVEPLLLLSLCLLLLLARQLLGQVHLGSSPAELVQNRQGVHQLMVLVCG